MKGITTILFDVDGTLLDTTELIFQALENSFAVNSKVTLTREQFRTVVGRPLTECYQILTGQNEVEAFCLTHHDFQLKNLHLSKPYSNTVATLKKLKNDGMKIAAVTSRKKKSTSLTLEQAGISPYLDFSIFADEVTRHKPDPESLNKAMAFLKSDPAESIMVGDSEADILGGKNAGVTTVGALYGFHGKKLQEFQPDFTIDDISQIIDIISDGQNNT